MSRPSRFLDSIQALRRRRVPVAAAKARGVYASKGRAASIDAAKVRRLRYEEKLRPTAIARQLKIGRASVYRFSGEKPEKGAA